MIAYQPAITAMTPVIATLIGVEQTVGQQVLDDLQTAANRYTETVLPIYPDGNIRRDGRAQLDRIWGGDAGNSFIDFWFLPKSNERPIKYPSTYAHGSPMPRGGILFSAIAANLNAAISAAQAWLDNHTPQTFSHRLGNVAGVSVQVLVISNAIVWAQLWITDATNAQAVIASQDARVIAAVASLVGMDPSTATTTVATAAGLVPTAWKQALNNPRPVVTGESTTAAALILQGWTK